MKKLWKKLKRCWNFQINHEETQKFYWKDFHKASENSHAERAAVTKEVKKD